MADYNIEGFIIKVLSDNAHSAVDIKNMPNAAKTRPNISPILGDLQREIRSTKTVEEPSEDNFYEPFLEEPQLLSLEDTDSGIEIEVFALQNIRWLKALAQTSKYIPLDRIYRNCMSLSPNASQSALINHKINRAFNDTDNSLEEAETSQTFIKDRIIKRKRGRPKGSKTKKKKDTKSSPNDQIAGSQFDSVISNSNDIEVVYDSQKCRQCMGTSRLPEVDRPTSQISNPIDSDESIISSQPIGFKTNVDSAIEIPYSVTMENTCENSKDQENDIHDIQSKSQEFKCPDSLAKKSIVQIKPTEKVVHSEHLKLTLTKYDTNNIVLQIIQSLLEILKHEDKSKVLFRKPTLPEAIRAITDNVNILSKENMAAELLDIYINSILLLIEKVFDFSAFKNFDIYDREEYIMNILEFCNCKQVCMKTINFLINELKELTASTCVVEKNYYKYNITKDILILYSLKISFEKYRTMKLSTSMPNKTIRSSKNQWQQQCSEVCLPINEEELNEQEFIVTCIDELRNLRIAKPQHLQIASEDIARLIDIFSDE